MPNEFLIYQDANLLVVQKPAGLATDAPEHRDDLLRRVRRRVSAPVWVVHRLERDVSGVAVFSLQKQHNAVLAKGIEERSFARRVTAVLRGSVPRDLRVMGVVEEKGLSLVEVDPKREKLSELSAKLQHQLLAPLHLSAIELPTIGWVRAAAPWAIKRLVREGATESDLLQLLLQEAAMRRDSLRFSKDTNAYRLLNEGGDSLPGITVDRYDRWDVVSFYETAEQALEPEHHRMVCEAVHKTLGASGVYMKIRRKQSNTLVDTRREDVAPKSAIVGTSTPETSLLIRENGVSYVTQLGDGLSTGIFLDQRENRKRIRDESSGKTLLNLFAYTGAFSVAAACGGAKSTMSVDAARVALSVLPQHLAANAVSPDAHQWVCAEVFGWLDGAVARKDLYDIVICDPPSYSAIKDGPRWTAEKDWPSLAERCAKVLAPGGVLWACTNHRGVYERKFKAMVLEGVRSAGRSLQDIESISVPEDFAPDPELGAHLKTFRITVR